MDDPALTYQIISGNLYGDDGLSGTLFREVGEQTYVYPIEQGNLTAGDNYSITYIAGTLTINKAMLSVTAGNQVIYESYPLPDFTFSYDGFVNNETEQDVFGSDGPGYIVDPMFNGSAGVYQIIPSDIVTNYEIIAINGSLYVNPYGNGAMAIRTILQCIEPIPVNNSGYLFIAHFMYQNRNATVVYVPVGEDNKIISEGKFEVVNQPELFVPGEGIFDVYFDGSKLVWSVSSLENAHKTAVSSEASSTSSRCTNKKSAVISETEGSIEPDNNVFVYPNPVKDKVFINMKDEAISEDITVMDILGKLYPVSVLRIGDNVLEIDISHLNSGLYLIKVRSGENYEMFRVIKQ
jgi:hypothetical protein